MYLIFIISRNQIDQIKYVHFDGIGCLQYLTKGASEMLGGLYSKLVGKKQKCSNADNDNQAEEEEAENDKEDVFTLTQVVSGGDSGDTTFHECTQVSFDYF